MTAKFTLRELDALASALAFICAGELDQADADIPRETFESAHIKVCKMQNQRIATAIRKAARRQAQP